MTHFKPIRSSKNPRFKAVIRLLKARGWQSQDRVAIFGAREVSRAVAAAVEVEEMFTCRESLTAEQNEELGRITATGKAAVWNLPETLFAKLAYGDRHDGVLAVARRPRVDLDRIALSARPLIVVIESVEKPGNIGAVARSAEAVGADALVLADPVCDLFHPNCIRASLGCVFSLQTGIGTADQVREWLVRRGVAMIAARVQAQRVYSEIDWQQGSAIVLGSESKGLSHAWSGSEITQVVIPMRGSADSLNVSVSAAILMFEAARQRKFLAAPGIMTAVGDGAGDSGR